MRFCWMRPARDGRYVAPDRCHDPRWFGIWRSWIELQIGIDRQCLVAAKPGWSLGFVLARCSPDAGSNQVRRALEPSRVTCRVDPMPCVPGGRYGIGPQKRGGCTCVRIIWHLNFGWYGRLHRSACAGVLNFPNVQGGFSGRRDRACKMRWIRWNSGYIRGNASQSGQGRADDSN